MIFNMPRLMRREYFKWSSNCTNNLDILVVNERGIPWLMLILLMRSSNVSGAIVATFVPTIRWRRWNNLIHFHRLITSMRWSKLTPFTWNGTIWSTSFRLFSLWDQCGDWAKDWRNGIAGPWDSMVPNFPSIWKHSEEVHQVLIWN